jgi:hypothetical protein
MLETVQNQYQVQGLELDYTVVCWDGDLRRSAIGWHAWKMSGSNWQKDKELGIATNGYRVLLTRARKGMIVFIPRGDPTGEDETRPPSMYDDIANYLISCGLSMQAMAASFNAARSASALAPITARWYARTWRAAVSTLLSAASASRCASPAMDFS